MSATQRTAAVKQERQRQCGNLLAPQRVRSRIGMKASPGKQAGPEGRGKSLDDDAGEPFCQSLGRCLQRSTAPTENRAQGPWQARKKDKRSHTRNDNRRVAGAR